MAEAKKQHFVPQFLLRNFLPEGSEHLFVFDKLTGKQWRSTTRDVGAEFKFNVVKTPTEDFDLEPFMGNMENAVAPIFEKINSTRSIRWLTKEHRRQISLFLAAQKLRTPAALAQYRAMDDLIRGRLESEGTDPFAVKGYRPFLEGEDKLFWADFYLSQVPSIATHFQLKDWLLLRPGDGSSFLISDCPVVLHNDAESDLRGNLGVACAGIQIYFPISPDLGLALWCPSIARDIRSMRKRAIRSAKTAVYARPMFEKAVADLTEILASLKSGRPLAQRPENVLHMNSLQVSHSERFIYSGSDDFGLASEMIGEHPVNRFGRRPQMA